MNLFLLPVVSVCGESPQAEAGAALPLAQTDGNRAVNEEEGQ